MSDANQPVLNLDSPFIDLKTGKILPPWNMFFQQFVQSAQPAVDINPSDLIKGFTPNAIGNILIDGTVSSITIQRGKEDILIPNTAIFVPVSIGDTIVINPTSASFKFIPQR